PFRGSRKSSIFYSFLIFVYDKVYKDLLFKKIPISARRNSQLLRNHAFSRAVLIQYSEIADFHALERSLAQESQNSTCGSAPSLRNCEFPRAGMVHRSGMADFYAREGSIAQE